MVPQDQFLHAAQQGIDRHCLCAWRVAEFVNPGHPLRRVVEPALLSTRTTFPELGRDWASEALGGFVGVFHPPKPDHFYFYLLFSHPLHKLENYSFFIPCVLFKFFNHNMEIQRIYLLRIQTQNKGWLSTILSFHSVCLGGNRC